MLFKGKDPVHRAQRLIASAGMHSSELGVMIKTIAVGNLWRTRKAADGVTFGSFAAFATAPQPHGLAIRTQQAMDEFGVVLHKSNLYETWRELLKATTRGRGQPRKNLAAGENTIPVFKLPTSHTARAKKVMLLATNHPAVFAKLVAGEMTLDEAARSAGLAKRPINRRLRYGVLDTRGVPNLSGSAQGKLLNEVFKAVGVDAQCWLIANALGPVLGSGHAQIWREHALARASNSGEQLGA
jgi:hypothetical protein